AQAIPQAGPRPFSLWQRGHPAPSLRARPCAGADAAPMRHPQNAMTHQRSARCPDASCCRSPLGRPLATPPLGPTSWRRALSCEQLLDRLRFGGRQRASNGLAAVERIVGTDADEETVLARPLEPRIGEHGMMQPRKTRKAEKRD